MTTSVSTEFTGSEQDREDQIAHAVKRFLEDAKRGAAKDTDEYRKGIQAEDLQMLEDALLGAQALVVLQQMTEIQTQKNPLQVLERVCSHPRSALDGGLDN